MRRADSNTPAVSAKILVVGTSGAGKSTLARELAARLSLRDIELDALFWEPHWTQATPEVFRARIEDAMSHSPGWVVHGNYNKVRDLTWGRAEIVIWLDYSRTVVMWRVLKRSVLRILSREPLWSGNRESLRKTFFSKESILLWAWQTHALRRRQYEELSKDPALAHLRIYRLRRPEEARALLLTLTASR